MAICTWCEREMTEAASCTVTVLHQQGEAIAVTKFGTERGWPRMERCGDCGVERGGYHHPGCDIRRCPVCGGQMFSSHARGRSKIIWTWPYAGPQTSAASACSMSSQPPILLTDVPSACWRAACVQWPSSSM